MKKYVLLLVLWVSFCTQVPASSNMLSEDEMTLNRELSGQFSGLWVNYHGRICPLQTFAIDFTTKLTGKSHYHYANAEQFLLGWIFFSEKWQYVPILDIKHPELKKRIKESGKACLTDFYNPDGSYKLTPYRKEMYATDHPSALAKEALKLDEKIQLIAMLQQGSLLKLFPFRTTKNEIRWYAPADSLPSGTETVEQHFVENFFPLYYNSIQADNSDQASSLIRKLSALQKQNAGSILPSDTHLNVELLSNKLHLFYILFMVNLTIGFIGIFFYLYFVIKNKKNPLIQNSISILLGLVFLTMTVGIAMRAYIAGRIPLSNGYETMLVIAWSALGIGLLMRKRSFLLVNFSFLLSGFTLLVAHIGSMNPQITPLVPVLQSPLLSIHVSMLMLAYGLCGFMFLNSLTAFVLFAFSGKKPELKQSVVSLKELSELFMFPATFLMGAGIFIGAIWANVSWGRYWGWDPKEVWALITFLLMSFTFHGKTLTWFKKPVFYHLFVILIFAAVLMTYFGVNYILGGKHSYAGG